VAESDADEFLERVSRSAGSEQLVSKTVIDEANERSIVLQDPNGRYTDP
jgi:hypothetical protein